MYLGRNLLEPKTVSIEQKLKITAFKKYWNFCLLFTTKGEKHTILKSVTWKNPLAISQKKNLYYVFFLPNAMGIIFLKLWISKFYFLPWLWKVGKNFNIFWKLWPLASVPLKQFLVPGGSGQDTSCWMGKMQISPRWLFGFPPKLGFLSILTLFYMLNT